MAYWIASLALIVFGFLEQFSVGQPFLMVGVAMLVLGPFRGHRLIFWPPLLAVIAYYVVYLVVVPFGCQASSDLSGTSSTVCSSLLGIHWAGTGIYNPSRTPAMVAGLLGAALTGVLTFVLLWWRGSTAGPRPGGA